MSYAELGSTVLSSAGGAISFVKIAFGEGFPTFLAGWFDWIGSITDCALGAIVFALSINYFLRWLEPYLLAIIILILFAIINFRGVRTMGYLKMFGMNIAVHWAFLSAGRFFHLRFPR
ncbi:MAG: amino acid permease [Candidatus Brockarchaeota archaeon]|nr:amino acid permease [Candidatus Brockarchaeota archaeon]